MLVSSNRPPARFAQVDSLADRQKSRSDRRDHGELLERTERRLRFFRVGVVVVSTQCFVMYRVYCTAVILEIIIQIQILQVNTILRMRKLNLDAR
jgi:hypothetical protein